MELSTHPLCSDVKGIVMIYCNAQSLTVSVNISVLNISVLAIFARRSRRVSLGDVTAHGPGLTKPRTPRD